MDEDGPNDPESGEVEENLIIGVDF